VPPPLAVTAFAHPKRRPPVNPAEYQDTQDRLLCAALDVVGLPVDRFLEAAALADTSGPVLDPTLYRQAAGNLAAVRELAEACQRVQTVMARHAAILLPLAALATGRRAVEAIPA
jgi:hypothetical protein